MRMNSPECNNIMPPCSRTFLFCTPPSLGKLPKWRSVAFILFPLIVWNSYSVLNDVCSTAITVSQQRSSASFSWALEAVRSVRERLLGGGNSAIEEQRANFAPYGSSSCRRGTNRAISKQWSLKIFCLADKNCGRFSKSERLQMERISSLTQMMLETHWK